MHYMMAAGAAATASGTLFTGMSDVWASTPKRGGRPRHLAGDQHGPNDTLDPALFTSTDYFRGRMWLR